MCVDVNEGKNSVRFLCFCALKQNGDTHTNTVKNQEKQKATMT